MAGYAMATADASDSESSSDVAAPGPNPYVNPVHISPRIRNRILSSATEAELTLAGCPVVHHFREQLDQSQDTINQTSNRLWALEEQIKRVEEENKRLLVLQSSHAASSSRYPRQFAFRSGVGTGPSAAPAHLSPSHANKDAASYYTELDRRANEPPGASISCFWTQASVKAANGADMENGMGNEGKWKINTVWRDLAGMLVDEDTQKRIHKSLKSAADNMINQLPRHLIADPTKWHLTTIQAKNPDGYETVL